MLEDLLVDIHEPHRRPEVLHGARRGAGHDQKSAIDEPEGRDPDDPAGAAIEAGEEIRVCDLQRRENAVLAGVPPEIEQQQHDRGEDREEEQELRTGERERVHRSLM